MIKKICISGPAASGKTYFIESIDGQLPDITILSESSRKVAEMYPDMPLRDIKKFRSKVYEFQRQKETVVENLMDKGTLICDRGVFDNLAFLFLQDKDQFNKELSLVLSLYRDKMLKPYDYIFYFDVDLLDGQTPLLKKALDDPLRKATIKADNYAQHVIDFRVAFIEVMNYFRGAKVIPITAVPDEEGFNSRNTLVRDHILSINNQTVRFVDKLRYMVRG